MNLKKVYILHSQQSNELLPLEISFSRDAIQAKMKEEYDRYCKEATELDERNTFFHEDETAAHIADGKHDISLFIGEHNLPQECAAYGQYVNLLVEHCSLKADTFTFAAWEASLRQKMVLEFSRTLHGIAGIYPESIDYQKCFCVRKHALIMMGTSYAEWTITNLQLPKGEDECVSVPLATNMADRPREGIVLATVDVDRYGYSAVRCESPVNVWEYRKFKDVLEFRTAWQKMVADGTHYAYYVTDSGIEVGDDSDIVAGPRDYNESEKGFARWWPEWNCKDAITEVLSDATIIRDAESNRVSTKIYGSELVDFPEHIVLLETYCVLSPEELGTPNMNEREYSDRTDELITRFTITRSTLEQYLRAQNDPEDVETFKANYTWDDTLLLYNYCRKGGIGGANLILKEKTFERKALGII